MIWPDWQYPHCTTSSSTQAFCTASATGPVTDSIVVTCAPASADIGVEQDRVGTPPTCTVQAPQAATPHPYFVPVRRLPSRRNQRSGMSGSPSWLAGAPLRVNWIIAALPRLRPYPARRA